MLSLILQVCHSIRNTVEPRFNEPLFNKVLDITNDILCPGQSYSKMYGIEPRYNEPWYNEFFDITNIFRKPKRKIYLDIWHNLYVATFLNCYSESVVLLQTKAARPLKSENNWYWKPPRFMNCISKCSTSGWRKLYWIAWQKSPVLQINH